MTAVGSLIRDVFRQARASGLTATLLTLTAVSVLICTMLEWLPPKDLPDSVDLSVFGFPTSRGANLAEAVGKFQSTLAGLIADTIGVLVTLIWTAGFLPSFFDPA